jgi:4a-hydroxytetrahydrobiopterin dehydratase
MSSVAPQAALSRGEASSRIAETEWRYVLGAIHRFVPSASLHESLKIADAIGRVADEGLGEHLTIDVRPDGVTIALSSPAPSGVTATDVELAARIDAELQVPASGGPTTRVLEVAIDSMDIAKIRPFWAAVLGYVDDPANESPLGALVDPIGRLPNVWFQQMSEPREQRNRIHLDVNVPHDAAEQLVKAAIEAGGTLVTDQYARSFWVLADAEGNEACVCTWQDRD